MALILMVVCVIVMFIDVGYMLLGSFGFITPFDQYMVVGLVLLFVSLFGTVFFSAVVDAISEADIDQQILDILNSD